MINQKQDQNQILELLNSLNFRKKLLERRKIFFWGPVFDESAKEIVDQLLFLELEDPGKEITLYINSPGGSVTAGLSIYDTMQMISSPVSTVCVGMAASMGAVLLSGGAKGKRYIFPNAEVMIHQPAIFEPIQDEAANLIITAEQIKKTKMRLTKILSENCNQPFDKVLKDIDRDYWMDAQQAVEYGIVDKIIDKIIL